MVLSPLKEIVILSSSFLSGCIIGVIYDVLRRIKSYLGFNSLLVDIGDVITFLVLSVCAYYSIYIINDGKVRWYEIFGIFSGFFVYMSVFSEYIVRVIIFTEKILLAVFGIIYKIITPVLGLIQRGAKGTKRVFLRLKTKKHLQNRKKIRIFYKIKCIFRKI